MRSSERRRERDRRLPAAHAQGVRWTRAVSPALPSALVCGLFYGSLIKDHLIRHVIEYVIAPMFEQPGTQMFL